MQPEENCPACEEGTCETHNTGVVASAAGVSRRELEELRHKTARSVRRLNNAIKRERSRPPAPQPEPIEEIPIDPPKTRKRNPVFAWGLSLVPRRKK